MGKIGRYEYPDIGPEQAASVIRTIENEIGETVDKSDRERLAELLGHKDADSGAFRQKLTALKRYGLLEGRGVLKTTDLADRVVSGDQGAYRDMLDSVDLLNDAFNRFDGEPVEQPAWESFLESQTGIEEGVDDIPGASGLRNTYAEFVRLIPREQAPKQEEVLDKERDFDYYVEKLDNPNTREPAIEAIGARVKNKKLPDAEPLDQVVGFVRENPYPDHHSDFFELLERICERNDLEQLNGGRQEEVVELMYEKMEEYSTPENIEQERRSLNRVMDILETLDPDDLVHRWWELLLERLEEGHRTQNEEVKSFAYRNVRNRLTRNKPEIKKEFFNELAEEPEDELWKRMAETEDEELRDDYEYLLGTMGMI